MRFKSRVHNVSTTDYNDGAANLNRCSDECKDKVIFQTALVFFYFFYLVYNISLIQHSQIHATKRSFPTCPMKET